MQLVLMPEHSIGIPLWGLDDDQNMQPFNPDGLLPPGLIADLRDFNMRWESFADHGWSRESRSEISERADELALRVQSSNSNIGPVLVKLP